MRSLEIWFINHNHGTQSLITTTVGEGVTFFDVGFGRAARVPRPQLIHILGLVKNMAHSYTYYSEIGNYSYTIFHILPIDILFE